ncbi:hypothetical protein Hte_008278 [Hypoxylon texense]
MSKDVRLELELELGPPAMLTQNDKTAKPQQRPTPPIYYYLPLLPSPAGGPISFMHTASLGLRIARVHSPFPSHVHVHLHRPAAAVAPLLSARARVHTRVRPRAPSHTIARCSRRAASTASSTRAAKPQPPSPPPPPPSPPPPSATPSASELVASPTRLSTPLPASATLNPPASTRPPPLDLPAREPGSSLLGHLFRLGKAYTTFYKAGLYAIVTNRRLLAASTSATHSSSSSSSFSSGASASVSVSTFPSRADVLLRERVRHDLSRLPVFGLLVLVCGEFTPLIVLVFPRLTPLTCRIPKQTDALRRAAESRRAASFRALRSGHPDGHGLAKMAAGHVCRSLGRTSALWDRIGLDSPFAKAFARRAIARIAADDAMIRTGGGVGALVDDEVVLACEDRGMDVRGQPVDRLRSQLQDWLRKTAPRGKGEDDAAGKPAAQKESEEKVKAMLLGLESI